MSRKPKAPALERVFNAEKIREIVIHEINRIVGKEKYDPRQSQHWMNHITQRILSKLSPRGETNFKYALHCFITDNRMQDYDCFTNALWDEGTDGVAVVDFANANLRCCVTVWGVRG